MNGNLSNSSTNSNYNGFESNTVGCGTDSGGPLTSTPISDRSIDGEVEQPTSTSYIENGGGGGGMTAPKYGTLIPNRVFVGGISCQTRYYMHPCSISRSIYFTICMYVCCDCENKFFPFFTSESELMQLFSKFGAIRGTKIIMDRAGVSKGYGFVTFETEDEAKRLLNAMNHRVLKPSDVIICSSNFNMPVKVHSNFLLAGNGTHSSSRPSVKYCSRRKETGNINVFNKLVNNIAQLYH